MIFPENIIIEPLITEKGTYAKADNNVYVFKVASHATKVDVKIAIEQLFKVHVLDVNTCKVIGKVRGLMGRSVGKTSAWKKAYVKIEKGKKIDLIEGMS